MMVDTGAVYTTFDSKTAPGLDIADEAPGRSKSVGYNVVRENRDVMLPRLRLGDAAVAPVFAQIATTTDPAGAPYGRNLLGMNVLSRFVVTVDWRNKELWLERAPGGSTADARPLMPAASLILLTGGSGAYRVESLGEPALKAGLRLGDAVTAIDGRSLADLPRLAAQRLLDGLAGTDAKVDVLRGGEHVVVTVPRYSRFGEQARSKVSVGLDVGANEDGTLAVVAVLPGSPAEKAGLNPGDAITAIDGGPCAR
jgi:hypothetical protein